VHSEHELKRVWSTPESLRLEWWNGEQSEFPSLWLRDNCPFERDSQSGQRLIDIADLPIDPKIRSVSKEQGAVVIAWHDEPRAASFDPAWLKANTPGNVRLDKEPRAKTWLEGSKLDAAKDFAWTAFSEWSRNPSARGLWMTRLIHDGIAFLSGVPCVERCALEAAEAMGIVLETNYGRLFDVRFVQQAENLADSDRGLGLHTDNPYRDPVPGFEVLHFLTAAPEGGDSLFADGFAIAESLRQTAPALFDRLARTPVAFAYRSKNAELYSEKPFIQLSPRGEVSSVHYNNRSIAPLRLGSAEILPFYRAYRHFAELLRDARFPIKIKLRGGDLVAFDNHRILHGRTGYCASKHVRHLQGCYLTRDSVLSEAALLIRQALQPERRGREENQ